MSKNATRQATNPFVEFRSRLFMNPNGDILRWLAMALYDKQVYFHMQELNKLHPSDFAAAMRMIAWCYQYGSLDLQLRGVVECIDISGDFNFRDCVLNAVGTEP